MAGGTSRAPSSGRAAAMAAAALALAFVTARGRGRRGDDRLFARINGGDRGAVADASFRAVTEFGSLWASIGAAAVLAGGGRRREATDALGAAIATWATGQALKRAFRRLRPYEVDRPHRLLIARPAGASWPSSHPAVLLAFVTVAGRDLGLTARATGALSGLAILVGVSRVYVGVHYPADVAGGLLVGRAIADAWSGAVSPRVLG